jgi:hypothetical protein
MAEAFSYCQTPQANNTPCGIKPISTPLLKQMDNDKKIKRLPEQI